MKKILAFFIAISSLYFTSYDAIGQASGCDADRYINKDYNPNVIKTRNITYGSNSAVPPTPGNVTLRLNFYEPDGDTATKRPLVILAFGGSFVTGDKEQVDTLARLFTKMGYVVASIDYRVGFFLPNEVSTILAVVRATHDMKAAVRFFRKEAATYRIDTNYIIVGGVSAGAITAIHTAFLNEDSEIPTFLLNDTTGLGGVEGFSGNPGFSTKVHGILNLSGTIGDTAWIKAGDSTPMIGFHDIGDQTVPIDTREVSVGGFPTGLVASGSRDLHARLDNLDITNVLFTFPNNGHVDYIDTDFEQTIDRMRIFMHDEITCKNALISSVKNKNLQTADIQIYPNPSNGFFTLHNLSASDKTYQVSIYDITGRIVYQAKNQKQQMQQIRLDYPSGMYRVRVDFENAGFATFSKNILIQ